MNKDYAILDQTSAETLHQAALTVLQRTGIQLDHERGRALLLEAGASEDADGRVLLGPEMVQAALDRVSPRFSLWHSRGDEELEIACGRCYYGPGSDALHQVDLASGQRRDSTLEDVGRNTRLAHALGFDFLMSMALPRQLDAAQLYPQVMAQMVRNSSKPMVVTAVSLQDMVHMHRMAALVAGGAEAFAARPFLLAYLEPVSPLQLDQVCVDKLLYCAEQGIPFVFAAGANCGIGAPITPEGAVVQGTAESLAGLVLALLANPRAQYVFGANSSSADMRSGMVCYGAPEWTRTVAMYADLGRFYGLPSWGTAGCTDAQQLDTQASWEAYRGILLAAQARPTLVHDMGYMAFGEQFDPRMLALTAELLREARHLLRPPDLSADALSTEVIDEVSRNKSLFLAHPQTRRSFRKTLWISKLINRAKVGQPTEPMEQRLKQHVERLLAAPGAEPLEPAVERKLGQYLAEM